MLFQDGMNRSSKGPPAFAVNDFDFIDSLFKAGPKVFIDNRGHLLWVEGMEVKNAVNGDIDHVMDVFVQRRPSPFVEGSSS
jgi:hypothetical protein